MAYLRIALRKNQFVDSLIEHFIKKNENAKYIDFSFIIINLVKKVFWTFMLQPLTYDTCMKDTTTDICMKDTTTDICMKDTTTDICMKDTTTDICMKDTTTDTCMKEVTDRSIRTAF